MRGCGPAVMARRGSRPHPVSEVDRAVSESTSSRSVSCRRTSSGSSRRAALCDADAGVGQPSPTNGTLDGLPSSRRESRAGSTCETAYTCASQTVPSSDRISPTWLSTQIRRFSQRSLRVPLPRNTPRSSARSRQARTAQRRVCHGSSNARPRSRGRTWLSQRLDWAMGEETDATTRRQRWLRRLRRHG